MERNQKDTSKNTSFKTLSERRVSFLSDSRTDRTLYAVAHKLEKVVAATILVTEGSLPDVLAQALRVNATEAHAAAYTALLVRDPAGLADAIRSLSVRIDGYLSLVRAATLSGLVSSMNADLLDREVGRVLDTVSNLFLHVSGGSVVSIDSRVLSSELLSSSAFDAGRFGSQSDDFVSSGEYPFSKSKFLSPEKSFQESSPVIQKDIKDIKDIQKDIRDNQKDTTKQLDAIKKTSLELSSSVDRKSEILMILKAHGPSDITHITKLIPGYSAKTILRELNALIGDGRIERYGNKRWSQYRLVG